MDISQYKELYIKTAREYLEKMSTCVPHFESNQWDNDCMHTLFVSAHSLKGQSYAMGFMSTANFCKILEHVFSRIEKKELTMSSDLSAFLVIALSKLKDSIDSIELQNTELDLTHETKELEQKVGAV